MELLPKLWGKNGKENRVRKFENINRKDLGVLVDILINNGKRIVVSEHYPRKLIRTYDVFILGNPEDVDDI